MPILEVEYVTESEAPGIPDLARRIADAAAAVLGSAPGHTWVKLRALAQEDYAENGVDLHEDHAPVFVRLLLASPPEGEERVTCARQLTEAVANCFSRPADHVHVLFEPAAAGRIAFGGQLRT